MMKTAVLFSLVLVACTDAADDPTDTDADSAAVSGSRHFLCSLEYETFAPSFATAPAASFDEKQSVVNKTGATAGDASYALTIAMNSEAPSNLVFNALIQSVTNGATIAYLVLPTPHTGGDYLFEIGGRIDPITPPGATQSFDFMRAYCSLVYE